MESFHTEIYIEPVGILLLSELEPGTDGQVDNLALLLQESLFISIIKGVEITSAIPLKLVQMLYRIRKIMVLSASVSTAW